MKKTFYVMFFVLLMSIVSVAADTAVTCDNALQHMVDGKVTIVGEACGCPFEQQADRTIVTFPSGQIMSWSLAASLTSAVQTNLASGNYKVTLASSDAYSSRASTNPAGQHHEQWHILFDNGQVSGTVDDIPDSVAAASVIQVVDNSLFINSQVNAIQAQHSFYHNASPNSVQPVCVAFDKIPENDVPEFGVLAALGVVGLAGLFIFRKRK